MEKNAAGVRKGAWTKEEDTLLRKCVENYGEGKWHQVPPRAGLNRCRKSCRLRWLNYLRPNIKRGHFTKDEVDLIVRLHKLLGNRWSLIAGRLPGRTANDVKNFWNTHVDKKPSATTGESSKSARESSKSIGKTITQSNIIRPRPRTFLKSQAPNHKRAFSSSYVSQEDDKPKDQYCSSNEKYSKNKRPSQSSQEEDEDYDDECIRWWGDLLQIAENGEGINPFLFTKEDHTPIPGSVSSPGLDDYAKDYDVNCEGLMSNLCLDVDVWEFVSFNDN